MTEYEQTGGGTFRTFRKKPKKPFDWGALFGGIFLVFIALAVLGSCVG